MLVKSHHVWRPWTLPEKVTFLWFIIDGFTHLTIELAYVILAFTTTAKDSDSYWATIWKEYSKADARWEVRDPNVMSLECITVCLGPLCLLTAWYYLHRRPERYVMQVIISTCELYGGIMTFLPDWIQGSPNLNGSTFRYLWIYLVFMNGLWVIVPALLLWDGVAHINAAVSASRVGEPLPVTREDKDTDRGRKKVPGAPSTEWYKWTLGLIVLYCVLIPGVLMTA